MMPFSSYFATAVLKAYLDQTYTRIPSCMAALLEIESASFGATGI
jgi:hypothetical protein